MREAEEAKVRPGGTLAHTLSGAVGGVNLGYLPQLGPFLLKHSHPYQKAVDDLFKAPGLI